MEKKNLFVFILLLIFSIGLISAVPGIPHQFYGNVVVNEQPSDDILVAFVDGQNYSTIILDGVYGLKPNTFFIEDPEGNNDGKKITFYVGGKEAGTSIFANNQLTKLDFSLTTTCGDKYCLGDETCSNCENDCGICTEPPEIFITSPENKIYNISKIGLNVYSNQNILIWMYSINSQTPQVFIPDIILTLNEGTYELRVIGINTAYQSNSKVISFSVDIPENYCGDGTCNNGESCSICPGDCGACSSDGDSSGGSSGGGGGGGGGGSSKPKNTTNTTIVAPPTNEGTSPQIGENNNNPGNTNEQNENIERKGFFSRITGSAIFTGKGGNIFLLSLGILVIIFILILIFVVVKKKRKKYYMFDYH
jgi:hypothetical protein